MKLIVITMGLLLCGGLFAAAKADYTVECTGANDDTGASVTGECEDGDFTGTDGDTGNSVSGDCEFDGDLDARDDETGEHVSGDCEGE